MIEDNAEARISCRGPAHLDLWMYGKSRFALEEGFAIFGLSAFVYGGTSLSIGRDCLMAEEVKIWTSDHHSIIDLETMKQLNFPADVRIEDRVWLSRSVHILKGVTIGAGSIAAARALVTSNIPSKELWGGVPAKCLRRNVSWVASHPANPYDIDRMAEALGIVAASLAG